MQIQLYNSLTKNTEILKPIHNNEIRMYSCGPTVYNYAHIGNMRAFLFADLLQRTLKTVGNYDIKWVMNITNIDDKTIRDSQKNSPAWLNEMGKQTDDPMENLLALTKFYEQKFINDIGKLGINNIHFFAMPKATDYIVEMQDLIKRIINKGVAYISEGSVYFNVNEYRQKDIYGKLFKIDFENFQAGTRIDSDQYEREQASDFVLWKARKEGEPFWDFEVDGQNLPGRPGWHIECSAMEYKLLGLPFDIHTGGVDLKFPHHEDEIAQSKAGYGIEPTNYWCHNEFLEVEGEKMSKSAGNFFTLRELEEKNIDPIDVRFSIFSAHYRTKYNFTFNGIDAAKKARIRVQDCIYAVANELEEEILINIHNRQIQTEKVKNLQNDVYSELANDLHTPKALANLFTFINNNKISELSKDEQLDFLCFISKLNDIFVAWKIGKKEEVENLIPQKILDLANQRLEAKQNKNFAEADKLRNEITALGYTIKDTKDGFEIEKI